MGTFNTFYGFDQLRYRVYSYQSNYKRFRDIPETRYEELKNEIHTFINRLGDDYTGLSALEKYTDMLGYISHKITYNHLPYDERIIMLLEACDPEFIHFKKYLGTEKTPDFNEVLAKSVRSELGFYDPKFVGYESDLFSKFFKNKTLLHGVKDDFSFFINPLIDGIDNFKSVKPEDYDRVSKIAQTWRENMQEDDGYLTAYHNVVTQNTILGLKGIREKGIFLVEAIDPELQMLQAFYDCPTVDKLYEQAFQSVGFYSEQFKNLEIKYAKAYKQELAEDPWSIQTKKPSYKN